jgi:hypothetical protein
LFFLSLLRLDCCWHVQPEIRPEVTGKIRESFENPPSLKASGVEGKR